MPSHLTQADYNRYLLCKEGLIVSELVKLCRYFREAMDIFDEGKTILFPESIANKAVTGIESTQVYILLSRIEYVSHLVSQLSWKRGSCKDQNKDIAWEALGQLGRVMRPLWVDHQATWQSWVGTNKVQAKRGAELAFVEFVRALLEDFDELAERCERILIKRHFQYLKRPNNALYFSVQRPHLPVYEFRRPLPEIPDRDRQIPIPSEPSLNTGYPERQPAQWYEHSSLLKHACFPEQSHRDEILFSRESAKPLTGLKAIRRFMEPELDVMHLQGMLTVLEDLAAVNPNTQRGKTATLMACQRMGEYSHSLSDSLKGNLVGLSSRLPFGSLRAMRMSIKLAVTRGLQFHHLKQTLCDSAANHQVYQAIKNELLSIRPLLRSLCMGAGAYRKRDLFSAPVASWIVSEPEHFQPRVISNSALDSEAIQIFSLFDKLSEGMDDVQIAEARLWIEKILCYEFPYPETPKERKTLYAKHIRPVLNAACVYQFSKAEKASKGQIHQDKKALFRLLTKRITRAIRLPKSVVIEGPRLSAIDRFHTELSAQPGGVCPVRLDYLRAYLDVIVEAIEAVVGMVSSIASTDHEATRKAIDSDPELTYAINYHATVIGAAVDKMKDDELFLANADKSLVLEFFALRWVRNNEMHNMNQPVGESLLQWFNPRFKIGEHRLRGSEISAYVVYLRRIVDNCKANLAANRRLDKSAYLLNSLTEQLQYAFEGSAASQWFNVGDQPWLYRDLSQMTARFLLRVNEVPMTLALFAEEQSGFSDFEDNTLYVFKYQKRAEQCATDSGRALTLVPQKRPAGEWTCLLFFNATNDYSYKITEHELFQRLGGDPNAWPVNHEGRYIVDGAVASRVISYLFGKKSLEFANSYLLSQGLQCAPWVTLHELSRCYTAIQQCAASKRLRIVGVEGGPLSSQWNSNLTFVVEHQVETISDGEKSENVAHLRRQIGSWLGKNTVITDEGEKIPRYDFKTVVNSINFFNVLQYQKPPLRWIQRFMGQCQNAIDVNFYVDGYTALHILAMPQHREPTDYIEIARYLIQVHNADPCLPDKHGDPALHCAVLDNDQAYCEFLLACDQIDVNQLNRQGKLAVEVAAKRGYRDLAQFLLPKSQLTPKQRLMIAIDLGDQRLVKTVLEEFPDVVNGEDQSGVIPLVSAAENGSVALLKLLVERGGDPRITDEGDSLLHVNCQSDNPNPALIRYLVEEGHLPVNDKNHAGDTPLHKAALCHYETMVTTLLELGAQVNAVNNAHDTPLHSVAQGRYMRGESLRIAQTLIDAGTCLTVQNDFAGTILHQAALQDHRELAELLLARAPHLLDRNSTGRFCEGLKPVEVAREHDNLVMSVLLAETRLSLLRRHRRQRFALTMFGGAVAAVTTAAATSGRMPCNRRGLLGGVSALLGALGLWGLHRYLRPKPPVQAVQEDCSKRVLLR